jgi:predicted nucleic acid-binding protein
MTLNHFARAERLDVLGDLLLDYDCLTTEVVREELREGKAVHPVLDDALNLEWLDVVPLDSIEDLVAFAAWVERVGSGTRDRGEASVFAATEITGAIAVSDDREAVRVGRHYGLEVHGTLWLLAGACRNGKLTETAAGNLIDLLTHHELRLPCTGARFGTWARQYNLL